MGLERVVRPDRQLSKPAQYSHVFQAPSTCGWVFCFMHFGLKTVVVNGLSH